jgi:hypothetical protein
MWSSLEAGPGAGGDTGDVTIKQVPAPREPSKSAVGGEGLSVRDVYREDGPGVVSVDVTSQDTGPGGGSGFVLDEGGHIGGPWGGGPGDRHR